MTNAKRWMAVLLAGAAFGACDAGPAGEATDPLIGGAPGIAEGTPAVFIMDAGCTGTMITSRLILTAAHCLADRDSYGNLLGTPNTTFAFNKRVLVTNSSTIDANTKWFDAGVLGATLHPAWVAACQNGCADGAWGNAPYPADLAILALQQQMPASWGLAAMPTSAPVGRGLFMTGYGCTDRIGGNSPTQFKIGSGVVVNPALQDPAPGFAASYFIMPGIGGGGTASLCNGDSGGPAFSGLFGGGNGGFVAGVNSLAYAGSNGVATMNGFARLDTQSARNFIKDAIYRFWEVGSPNGVQNGTDYCADASIMCSIGRKKEYLLLAKHCQALDGVAPECDLADPGPICDAARDACAAKDVDGWTTLSRECDGLGGVVPPCDIQVPIHLIGITSPAPSPGGGHRATTLQ